MPSPFPCSPVIREWSRKENRIEKKKKKLDLIDIVDNSITCEDSLMQLLMSDKKKSSEYSCQLIFCHKKHKKQKKTK